MSRRDHLIQLIGTLIGAILAGYIGSQGIPFLPKPAPPADGQVQPGQVQPPAPMPPPTLKADPIGSRVKLRTSVGGCTGAVVGPQRSDGRYLVVSAAHCVRRVGDTASGTMPGGQQLELTVQSIDTKSDCSWLLTSPQTGTLPFINLATTAPAVGRRVWVAGYGVHAPGVQRWGSVAALPNRDGQVQFRIAVSSGDSGGPIVDDETGELVAVVCCTAAFGQDASVFGAGPAAMLAARPRTLSLDTEWEPVQLPAK